MCQSKAEKKYPPSRYNGGEATQIMEMWTWHNQRSAIWIHTHENVITTYKASISTVTIRRQQTAETMMEKWNIIKETNEIVTAVLLYSGNHYTPVIIEELHDRPTRRLRTTEPKQSDPPTQRVRRRLAASRAITTICPRSRAGAPRGRRAFAACRSPPPRPPPP